MCAPNEGGAESGQSGQSAKQMGLAFDIAASVMNYQAKNKAFKANQENALTDYRTNVEGLGARATETSQAAAEAVLQQSLEGARSRAEANAYGGSAGLGGSTVRALIQQAGAEEGRSKTIVRANRDSQLRQVGRELTGARTTANRQIRGMAKGNPLALALEIGASTAKAFAPIPT